jgi:peptidoglycan hydrolase-like protein with peptidoglycan-binding domain
VALAPPEAQDAMHVIASGIPGVTDALPPHVAAALATKTQFLSPEEATSVAKNAQPVIDASIPGLDAMSPQGQAIGYAKQVISDPVMRNALGMTSNPAQAMSVINHVSGAPPLTGVSQASILGSFATDFAGDEPRMLLQANPKAPGGVGSQGQAVRAYQTMLAGMGIYHGALDGKYGPETAAAVKIYQHMNGLTADGKIGVGPSAETGPHLSRAYATKVASMATAHDLDSGAPAGPISTPVRPEDQLRTQASERQSSAGGAVKALESTDASTPAALVAGRPTRDLNTSALTPTSSQPIGAVGSGDIRLGQSGPLAEKSLSLVPTSASLGSRERALNELGMDAALPMTEPPASNPPNALGAVGAPGKAPTSPANALGAPGPKIDLRSNATALAGASPLNALGGEAKVDLSAQTQGFATQAEKEAYNKWTSSLPDTTKRTFQNIADEAGVPLASAMRKAWDQSQSNKKTLDEAGASLSKISDQPSADQFNSQMGDIEKQLEDPAVQKQLVESLAKSKTPPIGPRGIPNLGARYPRGMRDLSTQDQNILDPGDMIQRASGRKKRKA